MLQHDSTLTSSYQTSISYPSSESAGAFYLPYCSSQHAGENSSYLQTEFTASPSLHPCRFHQVTWPTSSSSAPVFKECLNGCSQYAYKFSMDIRQRISLTPWNRLPWTEEGWPLHHYCWSHCFLSLSCLNRAYWIQI